MQNTLNILITYKLALFSGIFTTFKLCGTGMFFGIFFGLFFGYISHRKLNLSHYILGFLWFVFSSTPIIIVFFWFHYPLQSILDLVIEPFWTSCFVLTLLCTLLVAKVTQYALDDFPSQYRIAGIVSGMSKSDIFIKIEFPLISRALIPQFMGIFVNIIHYSTFASLISTQEIFRIGQQINSQIYKPVEIYTILALVFVVMCFPINLLAYFVQKKFTRSISEN
jgi:polar amino acid transport system permease protein